MTSLADARALLLNAKEQQTIAEPTHYYALLRACFMAEARATPAQLIALLAAQVSAEKFGRRFDAFDAIEADKLSVWLEALDRLIQLIDLASSSLSAGEIVIQVANHHRFLRGVS